MLSTIFVTLILTNIALFKTYFSDSYLDDITVMFFLLRFYYANIHPHKAWRL